MKSSSKSPHRKKKRKMKSSKNKEKRTLIALELAAMESKPLTDPRGTIVRNNSAPTRPRVMGLTKGPSSSLILLKAARINRPRAALSTRSVRGLDATRAAKATKAAEIAHTQGLVALERVILKAKARNRTTKGAVAGAAEEVSRRLLKRAKEINKSN